MYSIQIIIPHISANNELLIKNIPLIKKNINPAEICILASQKTIDQLSKLIAKDDTLRFICEDDVIPGLTFESMKKFVVEYGIEENRTGWYFQQFLKLGWALRSDSSQWYASWDSDTFPLKTISFFNQDNKPVFNIKKEYKSSYFETIMSIWKLEKCVPYSFISEAMIFNKDIVKELLSECSNDISLFWKNIIKEASNSSDKQTGFSEFETYGTYVLTRYPDMYSTRKIKALRMGARAYGMNPTSADLWRASLNFETVSFERWSRHIPVYIAVQKSISKLLYFLFAHKKEFN